MKSQKMMTRRQFNRDLFFLTGALLAGVELDASIDESIEENIDTVLDWSKVEPIHIEEDLKNLHDLLRRSYYPGLEYPSWQIAKYNDVVFTMPE